MKMVIASEKNTWQQFLAGDKSCLGRLMETHFRSLFQYGCKFSKDEELIKDTIQELFIRLWETRANLSVEVNQKAYLFASLRRALHRKLEIAQKTLYFSEAHENCAFFNLELSVEQSYISRESSRILAARITTQVNLLPKRQKEVVYLKFFQELNRDYISLTMGISPQTVSNLLQLALKKLRVEFETLKLQKLLTLGLLAKIAATQLNFLLLHSLW